MTYFLYGTFPHTQRHSTKAFLGSGTEWQAEGANIHHGVTEMKHKIRTDFSLI